MMEAAEVTGRAVGSCGQDVGERGRCLFVVAAAQRDAHEFRNADRHCICMYISPRYSS